MGHETDLAMQSRACTPPEPEPVTLPKPWRPRTRCGSEFGAAANPQLAKQDTDVIVHSESAERQPPRDLLFAVTSKEQREDLPLPRRQPGHWVACGPEGRRLPDAAQLLVK